MKDETSKRGIAAQGGSPTAPVQAPNSASDTSVRPFGVGHGDVFRITLPMTLAYLTTPLIGLTDTAVVGRIGDAVALGGLAVGVLVFDFAFASFNFMRSGTTGLTAQADGRNDRHEVQAVFYRALILSLGIGLALIALEPLIVTLGLLAIAPDNAVAATVGTYVFIRMFSAPFALMNYAILGHVLGLGRGGLGLFLQIVVNGTNIALSVLLGLVLGYGIAGVALGTVIGEAVGAAVGLIVVVTAFDPDNRPSRSRVLDRTGFLRMIAVNRDIMIRTFCLLGSFVLFTRLGAEFGTLILAANGILMNLFFISSYFLDGMATASEQLVGRSVGARYRPAFDRSVKLTILWGLGFSLVLSLIFALGGNALVAFLTTDPAVRRTAGTFLLFAAATPLSGALAFVMDGIYIGATWSKTMRDMMLAAFLVFAVVAHVLAPHFGNAGLWAALLLFLGVRGVSLLLLLPRRRAAEFGDRGGSMRNSGRPTPGA